MRRSEDAAASKLPRAGGGKGKGPKPKKVVEDSDSVESEEASAEESGDEASEAESESEPEAVPKKKPVKAAPKAAPKVAARKPAARKPAAKKAAPKKKEEEEEDSAEEQSEEEDDEDDDAFDDERCLAPSPSRPFTRPLMPPRPHVSSRGLTAHAPHLDGNPTFHHPSTTFHHLPYTAPSARPAASAQPPGQEGRQGPERQGQGRRGVDEEQVDGGEGGRAARAHQAAGDVRRDGRPGRGARAHQGLGARGT